MRKPLRLPPEQLEPYLLELPTPDDPAVPPPLLDWQAIFGNAHPVELEVGFGKGLFLLTAASANPGTNYAGVEIEKPYVFYSATRMAKRGLPNVKLACDDARVFLRQRVPEASLQAIHVYFPDPWWKKRHHKRRVFTEEFARQCARGLKPGGKLHFASDVEDYYLMTREYLAGVTPLKELPPPPEKEPEHELDYLTNFERKKRMAGKPIYRALYERV